MSVLTLDDKLKKALVCNPDGTVTLSVSSAAGGAGGQDTELQLLCDEGNSDQKFYGVVTFNDDGTFATAQTIDLSGADYTVVGPVAICTVSDTDYEVVKTEACDRLADGTTIRFYYEHKYVDGLLQTSTSVSADGTAYTVVNEVAEDKTECYLDTVWTINPSVGDKGVTEEYWDINGTGIPEPMGGSNASPIPLVFTEKDACGIPVHPASVVDGAVPDQVNVLPIFNNTDPGASLTHQNCLTTFLYIPQDNTRIVLVHSGVSSVEVYMGVCNGKLGKVYEGVDTNGSRTIGFFNKGVYKVKGFVHDPTLAAELRLFWSFTGQGLQEIPASQYFIDMPAIDCKKVLLRKGDETYYELDGVTPLSASLDVFNCDPCEVLAPISPAVPVFDSVDPAISQFSNLISCEEIAVTDAAVATLTVPANANHAKVSVYGGTIAYAYDTATTPLNDLSVGDVAFDCARITIGKAEDQNGSPAELANWKMVANAGETARVRVCYYNVSC